MKSFTTLGSLVSLHFSWRAAFSSSIPPQPSLSLLHQEIIKALKGEQQAKALATIYKIFMHPESKEGMQRNSLEKSPLPTPIKELLKNVLVHPDKARLCEYADKDEILKEMGEEKDELPRGVKNAFWEQVEQLRRQQAFENQRRKIEAEKNKVKAAALRVAHLKAIFSAVEKGELKKMDQWLAKGMVDVNELRQGKSILYHAVLHKQLPIALHLLNVLEADPNAGAKPSPLALAYQQKDTAMIKLLLHHGACLVQEEKSKNEDDLPTPKKPKLR